MFYKIKIWLTRAPWNDTIKISEFSTLQMFSKLLHFFQLQIQRLNWLHSYNKQPGPHNPGHSIGFLTHLPSQSKIKNRHIKVSIQEAGRSMAELNSIWQNKTNNQKQQQHQIQKKSGVVKKNCLSFKMIG